MDSVSPQDVYARHLVSRRGYPLWTPETSLTLPDTYRERGLKIGDVGVVVPEDGSFDVFFNICLPSTHSLHRHTGVPKDFTPIQLEDRDISIFPEAECAGRVIVASSITRIGRQSSNEDTTRNPQPGPLNYEFTLSSKEGALLILPEGAERYYLRNQRPFLEEAIQHAIDWYDFAEQRLGRIISHDSLYLITGFYKARSWALASYQQSSGAGEVYAQFKATQVGGGNITTSYTWETTHALDWRVGPSNQYYNGTANQSVFIQGFKIAVRTNILGAKRVKVQEKPPVVRAPPAAAYTGSRRSNIGARSLSTRSRAPAANEPKETDADSTLSISEGSSDSDSIGDDAGDEITIQHVPQVSKPFHPSDIINKYLLESYPSAAIAITHDSQWSSQVWQSEPEELVQMTPEELMDNNCYSVSRQGVAYLEFFPRRHHTSTEAESPVSERLENREEFVGPEHLPPDTWATMVGDVPSAPLVKIRTHDLYDNTSLSSPESIPDVLSLPSPTPSLLEEPSDSPSGPSTKAGMWQPPTSVIVPSSSTTKPQLKSILKGSNNAQPRDSHADEDEMLSVKKVSRVRFNIPAIRPPGSSRLIYMKPPAFNLHWQLLPYNPRRSMRLLRFDIAFPVDEIAFQESGYRIKLSDADLDILAADGIMNTMLITFDFGPFSWEVDVQDGHSIRCRDVFEAIYKTFNEKLTLEEQRLVNDRRAVEAAFRLRCEHVPGLSEVERSFGWKRVDVLVHQTIFLGLTQPKSRGGWVLNLGTVPRAPRVS